MLVTAVVEGKEYLFANLNIPAGTQPLPLTIPSCVTKVKIRSGLHIIEAGVNDLVNLDFDDAPQSRGWKLENGEDKILQFTDDNEVMPVLVFNP